MWGAGRLGLDTSKGLWLAAAEGAGVASSPFVAAYQAGAPAAKGAAKGAYNWAATSDKFGARVARAAWGHVGGPAGRAYNWANTGQGFRSNVTEAAKIAGGFASAPFRAIGGSFRDMPIMTGVAVAGGVAGAVGLGAGIRHRRNRRVSAN